MKPKFIALAFFVTTAAAVVFYPHQQGDATATPVPVNPVSAAHSSRVEVVFVLDTTSSMSGMIEAAKEKIWSIASNMASAQQAPEVRMGLVAFRDRGDDYVTRVVDLSSDLDTVYASLMDFRADGGGDTPESVNLALHDAVEKISWSQNGDTYRVIFLVGDSPPHMDYVQEIQYPDVLSQAAAKGIVVNAIQCGPNPATAASWQQIAELGSGAYFQVEQSGSAVAVATPFDAKLAEISRKLDDTRLYYGSEEEMESKRIKIEATEKLHASSTLASRARRAVFNSSAGGRANLLGQGDLVEDVATDRVDLSTVDKDRLPASLQALSPDEQRAVIDDTVQQRRELEHDIKELAAKRSDFIKKKVDAEGGAGESLDEKIYSAVREQAAKHGLNYKEETQAY